MSAGAEVNAQNKTGSTPLHKAAVTNQIAVTAFLLDNGASPTVKNASGMLPEQLTTYRIIKERLMGTSQVTEELAIPKELHGRVIGRKGAKLREIREESQASISIPKPEEAKATITLQGRQEQVVRARELIKKVVQSVVIQDDNAIAALRPLKILDEVSQSTAHFLFVSVHRDLSLTRSLTNSLLFSLPL